jgi:L-threonylcarbamoyladenylate synthase
MLLSVPGLGLQACGAFGSTLPVYERKVTGERRSARSGCRRPEQAGDSVEGSEGPAVLDGDVCILDVAEPEARNLAASALDRGLVVAVPTDTVYGIAARLDRPDGIGRLFDLKGRRREVAIAVLVGDIEQAAALGLTSRAARRVAAAFWPGPVTIVVDRPSTPGSAESSDAQAADLGGDGRTVGIRVPDQPALRALLGATGPLATTSANRSGLPTPETVDDVAAVFGAGVAVYLDGGPSVGGPPSTVVRVDGETLTVLREGPIGPEALRAAVECHFRGGL